MVTISVKADTAAATPGHWWGWLLALSWGWLIFGGFGSIVVGVILLIGWPVTALCVTGLLLGINLIITGMINDTLALASRTNTPPS